MTSVRVRLYLVLGLCLFVSAVTLAQSSRQRQKGAPPIRPPAQEQPSPEVTPPEEQEVEKLKIDTDLVTVPVIATDSNGLYAKDLTKEEFNLWEDGTKQEIAFFTTVNAPFHVVLMLDTSASTQEKLGEIRRAAISFVEQLEAKDRVKVISFSDWVTDLNEFTGDRALLRAAINKASAGQGTKLYDAVALALDSIRNIQGRKAIVLFTDGVDRVSDQATFDSTLRGLDEEGVIVYPIRYDTRADTERLVRQQAQETTLPTIGVIRSPSRGTTAPTFPSDDPSTVPTTESRARTGPFGLPSPEEIMRRRREERARRDREEGRGRDGYPSPGDLPGADSNGRSDPRSIPGSDPGPSTTGRRGTDDSIDAMLDLAYSKADSYLQKLEEKSGGRLVRADTLGSLPEAFANIAAELRTQYALGYYPVNKTRDGKYRTIKVKTTRKNVIVRSRPGYVAVEQ